MRSGKELRQQLSEECSHPQRIKTVTADQYQKWIQLSQHHCPRQHHRDRRDCAGKYCTLDEWDECDEARHANLMLYEVLCGRTIVVNHNTGVRIPV